MNRSEIKEKAKEMIKGNLWYIWKMYLVVFAVAFVVGLVEGLFSEVPVLSFLVALASMVVSAALSVGAIYYIVKFVRNEKIEISDFIEFAKKHWRIAALATISTSICVLAGTILLVIPGIIASIGLSFVSYVVVDNPELSAKEIIKKSWNLTNGHKVEVFVFGLSFIGWIILSPLTLGLLYIWLIPYMLVATALFYEELKKQAK